MGFVLKLMVLSLVLVSANSDYNSSEEGFISMVLSQKGLNFIKDLLIGRAVSTMIPLRLPNIEKTTNIVLLGKVHIFLSDIIIENVDVKSSDIQISEKGINIVATEATANISMKWRYTYQSWLIEISDNGDAFVEADGMNIGLTLGLNEQNGTLELSLLDCGCNVEDLVIQLHGGASWLYQVVVDLFQGMIESAVDDNISKKIREGMVKLDLSLQSLPHEITIADIIALNVTFVGKPVLYNSSIEFKIDGLFNPTNNSLVSGYYHGEAEDFVDAEMIEISLHENVDKSYRHEIEDSVYCKESAKMIEISVHEDVLNSASLVLYKENYMHLIVDKISDQHLLNTAAWRWIIPRLYRQYPDDDIILNISASFSPSMRLRRQDIYAYIYADMIIDVLDLGEVFPVACISLEISASFSPKILGNDLVGNVQLENFDLSLKWSKIGRIHLYLLQEMIEVLIRTILVPMADVYLWKGVPLPSYQGLSLQNAEIFLNNSRIMMCSDIALGQGLNHHLL